MPFEMKVAAIVLVLLILGHVTRSSRVCAAQEIARMFDISAPVAESEAFFAAGPQDPPPVVVKKETKPAAAPECATCEGGVCVVAVAPSKTVADAPEGVKPGHWEYVCNGGVCSRQWVEDSSPPVASLPIVTRPMMPVESAPAYCVGPNCSTPPQSSGTGWWLGKRLGVPRPQ